jgi:hypothetical protein
MRTAVGLIVGAIGLSLIWGGLTDRNPLAELQVALAGKTTSKATEFKAPGGGTTMAG